MKIHILDKVLEYENHIDILDTMFDEVNNIVSGTSLIFSHLIIDG